MEGEQTFGARRSLARPTPPPRTNGPPPIPAPFNPPPSVTHTQEGATSPIQSPLLSPQGASSSPRLNVPGQGLAPAPATPSGSSFLPPRSGSSHKIFASPHRAMSSQGDASSGPLRVRLPLPSPNLLASSILLTPNGIFGALCALSPLFYTILYSDL